VLTDVPDAPAPDRLGALAVLLAVLSIVGMPLAFFGLELASGFDGTAEGSTARTVLWASMAVVGIAAASSSPLALFAAMAAVSASVRRLRRSGGARTVMLTAAVLCVVAGYVAAVPLLWLGVLWGGG
jgi:hypothetical protein